MRVIRSIHLSEVIATRMPEDQAGVGVVRRHHLLVRWSHWLNVPVLLGLILSGVSTYWASPVHQHKPEPFSGNVDLLADVGIWTAEQKESIAEQIKATTIILPASHAMMLSHPKEVGKVIEEAAGGRQN